MGQSGEILDEGILDLQIQFDNPVSQPKIRTLTDIEAAASDIQLPVLAVYRDSDLVRKRFTVATSLVICCSISQRLKGIFGLSIQAIMARAKNLSIISAATYKSFCINARKGGWHKDEPGKYVGR